jgi:hypothetical protein
VHGIYRMNLFTVSWDIAIFPIIPKRPLGFLSDVLTNDLIPLSVALSSNVFIAVVGRTCHKGI